MYVKHSLQGHLSGFQLLILVENSSRLTAFPTSNGTMFHTFSTIYFTDFKPYVTASRECNEKSVSELRS